MSLPTLSDLGHDLVTLTFLQRLATIVSPLFCVAAFFVSAWYDVWPAAVLAAAGYTFYSYGSTSHDLVHGNIGLPPWLNHALLFVTELAGVRSGHAYRAAHLHHHAHFPESDDVEASAAHGSLWQALAQGPLHQAHIWLWAVRKARIHRGWIMIEGIACLLTIVAAIAVWPLTPIPAIYVLIVVAGSWTFPLMTAYIPHRPDGRTAIEQTRRFRGKVASILFQQHLYHLEHHLYPRVPHQHWAKLAKRLDPHLDEAGVESIYLGF